MATKREKMLAKREMRAAEKPKPEEPNATPEVTAVHPSPRAASTAPKDDGQTILTPEGHVLRTLDKSDPLITKMTRRADMERARLGEEPSEDDGDEEPKSERKTQG